MATPITIPRLGWNMEDGVFVCWLKNDGAILHPGDALFTLESEKATEDVECLENGILRIDPNGPRAGDKVLVGAVIGHLLQPGEEVPSETVPSRPVAVPSPSAPLALQSPDAINSSGPAHFLSVAPTISPRAKRVARELGLDWKRLSGTGSTGRIRERDVRAAATAPASGVPVMSSEVNVSVSPIRQAIADHLLQSQRLTAPVTLTTTADVSNLVNLRNQFKAALVPSKDQVPSYTDFFVKLTATALQQHPLLNASWADDKIRMAPAIHIGIAVDTEAGLLVPVIRDVPSLSLKSLAARTDELITRAHQRKLGADEMQGGTFTVTNLGAYGIDAFTPIIHHPQCGILGVGRIQRRPLALGDQVIIREQVTLSLTFDHRIVDGGPAARFLQTLSSLIENPGPWLMP
jgi:pyruvate dehydrogenase E2 component (dihydrolipoamide acetyltransferase)